MFISRNQFIILKHVPLSSNKTIFIIIIIITCNIVSDGNRFEFKKIDISQDDKI